MWFWFVAAPAVLSSITAPTQLNTGTAATVTINLTDKAPAAGVPVAITITSTPAGLVTTVPPNQTSITITAGNTSGSFTIQAAANLAGQATITAAAGNVTLAATLTVAPAVLTGQLLITPSSVIAGGSATGTVTLSGPAPQGGVAVALSSLNTNIAAVPATVTVPAGQNTATFPITAGSPTTTQSTSIRATLAGATLAGTITVRPKTGKEGGGKEHIGKEIPIEKAAPVEVSPRLTPNLGPTNFAGPTLRSTESTPSSQPVAPSAQAFIRPEERPPVGQQITQSPT